MIGNKTPTVVLILSLFVLVGIVYADNIESIGYGPTENQAKNDALRTAIETVAGTKIFSESVFKNFPALQDTLLAASFGLVTSYEVLAREEKGQDKGWEVKVKATLADDVRGQWDKLHLVLAQKGSPSIMFCIKETLDGKESLYPASETQLTQKFKELGFRVIDRQWYEKTAKMQKHIANLEQNYDAVVALASQQGADMVVVGMLEGNFNQYLEWYGGLQKVLHSYNFRAKVIRTDTAQVVASAATQYVTQYDSLVHSRSSAGKAGLLEIAKNQYIESMLADIVKTWITEEFQGREVIIVVSNVKFRAHRRILESLQNLQSLITVLGVANYRNERLELMAKSKMPLGDLAAKIEKIEGLPLEVVQLETNKMEVRYAGAE